MAGRTTAGALLKQAAGNRTTWVEILKALDRYHAAPTSRHELAHLRALEMLCNDWLARHQKSPREGDDVKAGDLRALLAECVPEIDALAAEQQEDYQERLINTNLALAPSGTPEPEQLKYQADPRYGSARVTAKSFRFITHSATADKVTHSEEHGRTFRAGGTRIEHFDDIRAKPALTGTRLTDAEMAAIRIYSAGDYQTINPLLEGNESWMTGNIGKLNEGGGGETTFAHADVKAKLKAAGGQLDKRDRRMLKIEAMQHARMALSGLKKLPDQVVDGYRGFTWALDSLIPMYKRGATIVYKPFISTSVNVKKAEEYAKIPKEGCVGVLLRLKITHGKDIQAISVEAKEGEVLLLPGATFTVTDPPRLMDDGLYHITVTQTDGGGGAPAQPAGAVPTPVPLNALPANQQVPATVAPLRPAAIPMPLGRPQVGAAPGAQQQRARAGGVHLPAAPPMPVDPDFALRRHAVIAAEQLIAAAKTAEPGVTQALEALSGRMKGRLVGLEHRLKTPSSLTRKLIDRTRTRVTQGGVDAQLAINDEAVKANDVLRYTLLLDEKSYWANEEKLRDALMKECGYTITDRWDAWNDKSSRAFKGLTLRFKTKEGQVFELQVHTAKSFDIKMGTHEEYEEFRDATTSPERRKALTEYMAGKWAGTSAPPRPASGKAKK